MKSAEERLVHFFYDEILSPRFGAPAGQQVVLQTDVIAYLATQFVTEYPQETIRYLEMGVSVRLLFSDLVPRIARSTCWKHLCRFFFG